MEIHYRRQYYKLAASRVRSNKTDRFPVTHVPSSHQLTWIDGTTANNRGLSFGIFQDGVDVKEKQDDSSELHNLDDRARHFRRSVLGISDPAGNGEPLRDRFVNTTESTPPSA